MIPAAAARDGVLLEAPPARRGLAGVQNLRPRAFNRFHELGRQCGNAAKPLEVVKRDTFST